MFTLKTFDLPLCPAPEECYLNVIIDALKQKDRIPFETPDIGLGPSYVREKSGSRVRHADGQNKAGLPRPGSSVKARPGATCTRV